MNREDRRIREYFSRLQESPQRDASQAGLRRTIERSKDAYCDAQAQESLSAAEFLYRQGGYIRKRWWLAQGLVLLGLWFLLGSADGGDTPRRMLGAGGPLFAVLALPELWKSRNANVLEIESVSYFSLRQIYAARLVLFGVVDLTLLSVFAACTVASGRGVLTQIVLQFLLPCVVTCCICFTALYHAPFLSEAAALSACLVWSVIWLQAVSCDEIYRAVSEPLWYGALALASAYLAFCIRRGQEGCGRLWERAKQEGTGGCLWNS